MPGWKLSDEVLRELASKYCDNRSEAHVLPKVAVLNALYGTNVLAIREMARHIASVFRETLGEPGPDIVERIAAPKELGVARRFLSFASKYCHFFVSPERFAIYDSQALAALCLHLGSGRPKTAKDSGLSYPAYLEAINRLRERDCLSCSYAELDRYLWLCGERLDFARRRKGQKTPVINKEALELFSSNRDYA